MAQTIPHTISTKWKGEQRVFAVLKRLPEEVVVYYEPIIDNRCPDFVVILPEMGVLLIEVKDWKCDTILPGSNLNSVMVRVGEHEKPVPHPLRQVRDYQQRLMDRCREDKYISKLVHASGHFKFPFGRLAILTNITREKLNSRPNSEHVFPSATVATKDQLSEWQNMSAKQLADALKGYFDRSLPRQRMTPNQVNVMKAILHPEILIAPELDVAAHAEEPVVKVLDLKQESLARDVGEGHRLVFGVAGSGKTVLLIARAKLIARLNPSARVLVLCYNVAFGAYLEESLMDCPKATIKVMTFHRWAARNGVRWDNNHDDDSRIGELLHSNLKAGALDSNKYDTILIDEAQDFDSTWYPCVLAAMKDPTDGDLLIVGDGSQGLYKRRKVSWKQLGIQASGRTQYLHQNYRNTRQIMEVAARFAGGIGEADEDGLSAPLVDPEKCVRVSGPVPTLHPKKSRGDELDRVVRVVSDLLDGHWDGDSVSPLKPDQIAILYPADNGLIVGLREKLKRCRDCPVLWVTERGEDAKGRIGEPGVKILTLHSAKGLQFKAVIIVFANDCPGAFPGMTVEDERSLFYVGLSRAEDYLAITCSGKMGFGAEIEAALTDSRA